MNKEEYTERMKDKKYRDLIVTKCEDKKDYVFISYRGNSWKKVLTEITYKLQKEYGLRIYFDKEFASDTNIWVEQFIKNMDAPFCKALICFFDEEYVTSYATLLELMHAMNPRSKLAKSIFPISFPIDWGKLDDSNWNTGLGEENPNNPGWKEEKEAFIREFNILKKKYPDIEDFFYEGAELRACDCKEIMAIIQPRNKRDFVDEEAFYKQFIVDPLKQKCPGVFGEVSRNRVLGVINNEKDIKELESKNKMSKDSTQETSSETIRIVSDGNIYHIKGSHNAYDAFYRRDNGEYTVLRGSKLKYNEGSIPQMVQEKCKGNITENGILLCDISNLSVSTAAKLIKGTSVSGKDLKENNNPMKVGETYEVSLDSSGTITKLGEAVNQKENYASDAIDNIETQEETVPYVNDNKAKDSGKNPVNDFSSGTIRIVSDGSTYHIKGKNCAYDAFYRCDNGVYTVLGGSKLKYNEAPIPKMVQEKCKGNITENGILLCDISNLSISTAAKLIKGTSTSGCELKDNKNLMKPGETYEVSLNSTDIGDGKVKRGIGEII